jgi:xanthine/CO dehydrogenase XdhC/CoxF family maturation factor
MLAQFDRWQAKGRRLVLATVVATEGSTYSKPGHRILLADDGRYQGLVSGGCLEGDLAAHAQAVLSAGSARVVSYDLRRDDDAVFGLGIGCDGLIRVLLQPLFRESAYEPFASLAAVHRGEQEARCLVVFEAAAGGPRPGAAVLLTDEGTRYWQLSAEDAASLVAHCSMPGSHAVQLASGPCRALHASVLPMPRLLVLGAGLDAVPLVEQASQLGYRVTVFDHRPAQASRGDFSAAEQVLSAPAAELTRHLPDVRYIAAVVMSHQLDADRAYLAELARSRIPYVGLLGPRSRRDRLLRELGPGASGLATRLHAPAGLDIGADTPQAIALAILAEIESHRHGRGRMPLAAATASGA